MRYTGIIGRPLKHTLSPLFQTRAFRSIGWDVDFRLWEVTGEELAETLTTLRSSDCLGACITAPHKEALFGMVDQLTPKAREIGAINWIINRDGVLWGDNTDGEGFVRAVRSEFGFEFSNDTNLFVYGAGGAARAIVKAALPLSGRILIANRTFERARKLADDLGGNTGKVLAVRSLDEALELVEGRLQLLVNTASGGMIDATSGLMNIDRTAFDTSPVAYEISYSTAESEFMVAMRAAGIEVRHGLAMLIYQGALGFELLTSQEAPVELMFDAVKEQVHG